MTKFKGGKMIDDITKALDVASQKLVTQTQSLLSKASPVDTGRLASSWVVNENSPSEYVPPEEPWASLKKGDAPIINVLEYTQPIKYGRTYYIASNLPYSKIAALDPQYSGKINSKQWFTSIRDNMSQYANKIYQNELRKIK